MGTYRREVALAYARRPLVVLLAIGLCLGTVSPSLVAEQTTRSGRARSGPSVPLIGPSLAAEPPAIARAVGSTGSVDSLAPQDEAAEAAGEPDASYRPMLLAEAGASTAHLDEAGLFNVLIALSFVDGIVIPSGERLVFDDIARTWDYREDPSYVIGKATSVRGLVDMRGGGVCTVSTALWRAALATGLRTDRRQSHNGLMEPGDPGLDATNTLIIANDSNEAVTVHVWLDGDVVRARLLAEAGLDRVASISEPQRIGNGRWLVEQEVTWADGRTATNRFASQYYW